MLFNIFFHLFFMIRTKNLDLLHQRVLFNQYTRLKNFRELAHCIHIIAMVGLHRLKKKSLRRYYHLFFIKELFKGKPLEEDCDVVTNNEIITGDYETDILANTIDRFVIIYITSDKSCSGFVNGSVLKYVLFVLRKIKYNLKTVRLVSIGKKGYGALKRKYRKDFFKIFLDVDMERNSLAVSYIIVYKLMKLRFEKGFIFFNRFINIQFQKVAYYQFFSFSFLLKKLFYEQHRNKLYRRLTVMNRVDDYYLGDLYKFSMSLLILDALKENFFSETAYRARTMETMITNLDVLINSYWINYQKVRQRSITDEIIEILNGANVANEYSVNVDDLVSEFNINNAPIIESVNTTDNTIVSNLNILKTDIEIEYESINSNNVNNIDNLDNVNDNDENTSIESIKNPEAYSSIDYKSDEDLIINSDDDYELDFIDIQDENCFFSDIDSGINSEETDVLEECTSDDEYIEESEYSQYYSSSLLNYENKRR